MNIYICNFGPLINKEALKDMFAQYGDVSSVRILIDRLSGESRGFGFVNMPDAEAAMIAINALNGKMVNGKRMTVNQAESRHKSIKRKFLG